MWNDTDIPLAYLITFRSYGTWLHGDERGSVNRFRNQFGSARLPPETKWRHTNTKRLKQEVVILDAAQRNCVEVAADETCKIRKWKLYALNVRTNHVHLVVSIGEKKPEIALNAFKANATREMRVQGCWKSSRSPWADKGSKRRLWNEKAWRERLITFLTDRAMNFQTSMTEVRTACGSGRLILATRGLDDIVQRPVTAGG